MVSASHVLPLSFSLFVSVYVSWCVCLSWLVLLPLPLLFHAQIHILKQSSSTTCDPVLFQTRANGDDGVIGDVMMATVSSYCVCVWMYAYGVAICRLKPSVCNVCVQRNGLCMWAFVNECHYGCIRIYIRFGASKWRNNMLSLSENFYGLVFL